MCLNFLPISQERPMRKWEENVRIDLKVIYVNTRNLIGIIEEPLYAVLNLLIPKVMELVSWLVSKLISKNKLSR